eukprot:1159516-Pelagomonas_calceolata.AAC.3
MDRCMGHQQGAAALLWDDGDLRWGVRSAMRGFWCWACPGLLSARGGGSCVGEGREREGAGGAPSGGASCGKAGCAGPVRREREAGEGPWRAKASLQSASAAATDVL